VTTRHTLTLTGDHNQCPGCGELFNSTYSFDLHRFGEHGVYVGEVRRRCLTVAEMEAKGMTKNKNGWWISSVRPDELPRGSSPAREGADEPRPLG
jgi:hypothetical protein